MVKERMRSRYKQRISQQRGWCHSSTTNPGYDSTSTHTSVKKEAATAPQKAVIKTLGSVSPHPCPRYHLLTNLLASTAHQLINETVNADFSGLCVYFHTTACEVFVIVHLCMWESDTGSILKTM